MDPPHSDACLVQAYPAETTEAFCDGHNVTFEFFDGVPRSILYDNTKLAVARILGDGRQLRNKVFSELQSHYLFADRFGRPGKGNDKGKVEGLVGYARHDMQRPAYAIDLAVSVGPPTLMIVTTQRCHGLVLCRDVTSGGRQGS